MLTLVFLAISLSLDAFGVGVAYGIQKIRIPIVSKLIICLFSILYSYSAIALGNSLSSWLPPYVSKVFGIAILLCMGLWIIFQALARKDDSQKSGNNNDKKDKTLVKFAIKSLGITIQVIKDPARGDIDSSGVIDKMESLLLGLALSVDAIGVGIGSSLAGYNPFYLPYLVGMSQLAFLYAGTYIGNRFAAYGKINKKLVSVLPGVILLFLAVMRIY